MRFAVVLTLVAACGSKSANGLPPATDWNTGETPVVPGQQGLPNPDPHGGRKADPHAGVEGAPPLTDDQIPNDETHAHVDHDQQQQLQLPPDDPTHAAAKDPAAPIDPNKRIKGVFKLNPKVADKMKVDGAIFLIVKKPDAAGQPTGAALAVDRVTWKGPGQAFELGFEDVTGEVIVQARFDHDGDASTKEPGDVIGTARVKIPSDKVVIELDTVLP